MHTLKVQDLFFTPVSLWSWCQKTTGLKGHVCALQCYITIGAIGSILFFTDHWLSTWSWNFSVDNQWIVKNKLDLQTRSYCVRTLLSVTQCTCLNLRLSLHLNVEWTNFGHAARQCSQQCGVERKSVPTNVSKVVVWWLTAVKNGFWSSGFVCYWEAVTGLRFVLPEKA